MFSSFPNLHFPTTYSNLISKPSFSVTCTRISILILHSQTHLLKPCHLTSIWPDNCHFSGVMYRTLCRCSIPGKADQTRLCLKYPTPCPRRSSNQSQLLDRSAPDPIGPVAKSRRNWRQRAGDNNNPAEWLGWSCCSNGRSRSPRREHPRF